MLQTRTRSPARPQLSPRAVDLLLASLALLVVGAAILLTPAFTDYEAEAEPAIAALARGDVLDGLQVLPIYAGSVLLVTPLAMLTHALGGGDLALFRIVAVPGAFGVVLLAGLAGSWLREAAADRKTQLLAVGAMALSPCVALSWNYGHFEEPLVASLAIGGLILTQRADDRSSLIGGALLGLAVAGKLWAIVLLPVALAAAPDRRAALRIAGSSALVGALFLAPYVVARLDHVSTFAAGTGDIFSRGNAWWFLGRENPAYNPDATVRTMFTTDNSARLAPALVSAHARTLIVLLSVALSAAWAWRVRPSTGADARKRLASLLMLAAAVLWWRALLDPWFQPYYLTAALMALVLADARFGRLPQIGLVAWAALWLLHGQDAPDFGLSADQASLLGLSWMLPVGVLITRRALKPDA